MSPYINTRVDNGIGILTLDRPAALNALDRDMIAAIAGALSGWRSDSDVKAVIIESASPKAFCAGGDMRQIRAMSLAGDIDGAMEFFRDEYAVNLMIAEYPKPYAALIDGICMGGGIGLTAHGRYRIVSERAVLAMPEVAIGYFPDVGTTYLLPRLAGAIGTWLALTGTPISGRDAVAAGLATHFVPSAELCDLRTKLIGSRGDFERALSHCNESLANGTLEALRPAIDRCFGHAAIFAILTALREDGSEFARRALTRMGHASPYSLKITLDLLTKGRGDSLRNCLARELEIDREVIQHPDLIEGVRAVLIEKDRNPLWVSSLE